MTYNVAGDHARASRAGWVEDVCATIARAAPDLLATQEFPTRRPSRLVQGLAAIGLVPGDGGERERTFYKPEALRPRGHKREAVDAVGETRGLRYLNWSGWLLRDGIALEMCNVHLVGSKVKTAAAEQIAASPFPLRTIVAGDFNLRPAETAHRRLLKAGWQDSATSSLRPDSGPTYHGHGAAAKDRRIDWILAPEAWAPVTYDVHRLPRVEDEPSDHHPVVARLEWDPRREIRGFSGVHGVA